MPPLETAPCISIAQIVGGETSCEYCEELAVAAIQTGADPEPSPMCPKHSHKFVNATLSPVGAILGWPQ